MELIIKPYKNMTQQEKNDIIIMLRQVWNSFIDCCEIHHKDLKVQSFYIYDHQKVIAYVGVILQSINHNTQTLTVGSLSCVAVLKEYRGKGIGEMIVSEATQWMESQTTNLGIFTCHPSLVEFYTHHHCWKVANRVILKGSHHKYAISSDKINVTVLIYCFLENLNIENTTLYLNLPIHQFV